MTMFPANMPEMPPEMMGPVMDNPQGFADAMGSGMEAFSAAMEGGGGMEAAFEAFGDAAGPMMAEMGIPQDFFDAVGEMVGAAVGPAMMMAPADAGGGDMGAMMMDAVDMMMPEGMDMPPEVGGAMMDMGNAMGDSGCNCHEVAGEFMPPAGDPGYPMPIDAAGDPVCVPGDPGSVPMTHMDGEPILQAPPADGACADMGTMMPPPGGYDHPPMDGGMTMPEPMTFDLAIAPALGEEGFVGADPMADAMGGGNMAAPTPEALAADAMDAAMGSAMDGAMDQGGAPIPVIGDEGFKEADPVAAAEPAMDEPDPSAGMG
jgi:hypothetical protein